MLELTGFLLVSLAVGTFVVMDGFDSKDDEPEALDEEMETEDPENGLLVLTSAMAVSDTPDDLPDENFYLIRSEMTESAHSEEDVVCAGEPGVVDKFDAAYDVIEFYHDGPAPTIKVTAGEATDDVQREDMVFLDDDLVLVVNTSYDAPPTEVTLLPSAGAA